MLGACLLLSACDFSGLGTLSWTGSGTTSGGTGGGTQNPGGEQPAGVSVSISPVEVQLNRGASFGFACVVTGATETGCTYSVTEAQGGAVTAAGVYTAPATDGVYHVVATSKADATKSATSVVTVAQSTSTAAKPWVTGYYAAWFWHDYRPDLVDYSAMTHLVFGRVAPGNGSLGGDLGKLIPGATSAMVTKEAPNGTQSVEDYMIDKAHAAGIKALIMLGGDGADGVGFLRNTTDARRPAFVKTIVDYMVAHNYDGVDVDWENGLTGGPEADGVAPAEAQRRLKALLAEIRTEAGKRSRYNTAATKVIITYPGYTVNNNWLTGGKVDQWQADVAALVDQYNLMSYGVGTAWNGDSWYSWFTGPLYGATSNTPVDIDSSIKAYTNAGVPRSKMGLGIGFYGIYYGPTITGPRQPTEGNNIFEIQDASLAYNELVRKGYLSRGTYKRDTVAKATYRTYGGGGYIPANDTAANPAGFLSYEDATSIAEKATYVKSTGLGGAILWTINYGWLSTSNSNPLLTAVKAGFIQ